MINFSNYAYVLIDCNQSCLVPICVCGHFAFIAFLGQSLIIPLTVYFTSWFGRTAGNILVWSILIFGNTAGVVIYYQHVLDSFKQ